MRILVTGAAGFFGHNFCSRHANRFEVITTWHRTPPVHAGAQSFRTELADPETLDRLWAEVQPDGVLHLAAVSSITDCRDRPEEAEAVNVRATQMLAERAAADGARMVFTSTDLVFDGTSAPYSEADSPTPLFEYARTKADAELAVLGAGGNHLVCRVALCYGPLPGGGVRQVDWIVRAAEGSQPVELYTDEFRSPIDSFTLADALAELLVGCISRDRNDGAASTSVGTSWSEPVTTPRWPGQPRWQTAVCPARRT